MKSIEFYTFNPILPIKDEIKKLEIECLQLLELLPDVGHRSQHGAESISRNLEFHLSLPSSCLRILELDDVEL